MNADRKVTERALACVVVMVLNTVIFMSCRFAPETILTNVGLFLLN